MLITGTPNFVLLKQPLHKNFYETWISISKFVSPLTITVPVEDSHVQNMLNFFKN